MSTSLGPNCVVLFFGACILEGNQSSGKGKHDSHRLSLLVWEHSRLDHRKSETVFPKQNSAKPARKKDQPSPLLFQFAVLTGSLFLLCISGKEDTLLLGHVGLSAEPGDTRANRAPALSVGNGKGGEITQNEQPGSYENTENGQAT